MDGSFTFLNKEEIFGKKMNRDNVPTLNKGHGTFLPNEESALSHEIHLLEHLFKNLLFHVLCSDFTLKFIFCCFEFRPGSSRKDI